MTEPSFAIAGRRIGAGAPPYLVAEMSANHAGSLESALAIMAAAKGAAGGESEEKAVGELLRAQRAKVHAFHLIIVGEGLEKKKDDFVAEVMAQAGGA